MKKSKGRKHKYKKPGTARHKANRQILPALAAVGGACGLATSPAAAIELGQVRVDSVLGQPLQASIAYALAPNEQLYNHCIFLQPGLTANGIPTVTDARVTISDTAIVVNSRVPVREPLLSLRLSVDCAYTARLARDYTLMIDPALPAEGERATLSTERPPMTPVQTATVAASGLPSEIRPAPVVRRSVRRPRDESPIAPSSRYLVKAGDSLSLIGSRIENRSIALWPAVDAIFAANPHAFLDNDPNLLKSGSWLDIPDMSGAAPVVTAADSLPVREGPAQSPSSYGSVAAAAAPAGPEAPAAAAPEAVTEAADEPAPRAGAAGEASPAPAARPEPDLVAEAVDQAAPDSEAADAPAAETRKPELRPGDLVIGTDNPFVVPLGPDEVSDIPDTALEGPQVSRPVPTVAVTAADDGGISGGWSWLLWLGGAGVAIIVALLLFGRQIRERVSGRTIAIPDVPSRRRDDKPTPRAIVADIDFNFDADTLTPRKIDLDAGLDADLGDGSGLHEVVGMDVAQDFGFSATDTAMDMEITEEAAREAPQQPTDVIPPQPREEESILESEILPEDEPEDEKTVAAPTGEADDEEADYSMSMRIDMTRQLLDDNTATTRDLQAIMVDSDVHDPAGDTSEYSISKEADYQILEQDYEEELTATQKLNREIEAAARALADEMGDVEGGGETSEMPVADPDNTAELTSNLPATGDAENEEFGSTGASLDLTVDMPADDDASADDETVEHKKSEAS